MRRLQRARSVSRDLATALSALVSYAVSVVPVARWELWRWRRVAEAIPDPGLRRVALETLAGEAMNVEAAAVFAILAPLRSRWAAARALVAIQVLVDYVDTLSEQPAAAPLHASLTLHTAVSDALSSGPRPEGRRYYDGYAVGEDGGYLAALLDACSRELTRLPAFACVQPVAERAASRCAAGQSRTHTVAAGGVDGFAAWARTLDRRAGFTWWEAAAGASSSVAVHALIAAAADPLTTKRDALLVDAAYYPPIGALTVLFDSLIDRSRDAASGSHNYMAYYAGRDEAAERLAAITNRAQMAVLPLRRRRRHEAIVAGVAGFYLGASDRVAWVGAVRELVVSELGGIVQPVMSVMRVRRRLSDRARR